MKLFSTLLAASLMVMPCAALINNPWKNCVHPQEVECDIDGGPANWDDVMRVREHWAKRAKEEGDKNGDPENDDPSKWGGADGQAPASAYGDACTDYHIGGDNGADVKVCQKRPDGNFGNVKSIPFVCFSNYMDVIMNECRDGDKISGKLWADKYGAGLQII